MLHVMKLNARQGQEGKLNLKQAKEAIERVVDGYQPPKVAKAKERTEDCEVATNTMSHRQHG
jgi:hypothetical protein